MAEYIRVECTECGYSQRVEVVEDEELRLVIEAAGWIPNERETFVGEWLCEACAKK